MSEQPECRPHTDESRGSVALLSSTSTTIANSYVGKHLHNFEEYIHNVFNALG